MVFSQSGWSNWQHTIIKTTEGGNINHNKCSNIGIYYLLDRKYWILFNLKKYLSTVRAKLFEIGNEKCIRKKLNREYRRTNNEGNVFVKRTSILLLPQFITLKPYLHELPRSCLAIFTTTLRMWLVENWCLVFLVYFWN